MNGSKWHIGIMGGTFDPFHNAHLALATRAYEQFSLDKVWILPNGNPPHKHHTMQADIRHRMKMVQLAIESIPYLELCDAECTSPEYHYTFETLQKLNQEHPDTQFYFIMGADSLFDFDEWRKPEVICRESILLAATRDHCDREKIQHRMNELEKMFGADIRILDTPDMEIASEDIRQRIFAGQDISHMVPPAVEDYIQRVGLYKNSQEENHPWM
jgi:nicotinate-nucleotide adenylyltransferase